MKNKAKVSVIITCYNYGKYLKQAIESILTQKFQDYELIIVDDASTDITAEVLRNYSGNRKTKTITHIENQGLVCSCYEAIENSSGEYIIRLDADDYFDENALLVLSNILDNDLEIGLVYPDYFLITEGGIITEHVRLPRLNEDIKIFDIAANGAATMFRRSCYDAVGGYDLSLRCQDGYDIWLKLQRKFRVYNVNIPLFYYRRHGLNLTENNQQILKTRRYIKKRYVNDEKMPKPCVLGIVPARVHDFKDYLVLSKLGDEPLISFTIKEAMRCKILDKVVCTTEDDKIAAVAKTLGAEIVTRSKELAEGSIEQTVLLVLNQLSKKSFYPDVVVILYPNSPFKRAEHITEAVNTLLIFDIDSVVSICEDKKFHYQHGPYGLVPLFEKRLLREEKDALYEENGAICASHTQAITKEGFLGSKLGHITMTSEESIHIDSEFDFWIADQMVKKNRHLAF